MHTDPRIDTYIAKQPDFARPILAHVRAVVHEACPDVEEDDEVEHADLRLRRRILCGMAAFKQHASFGYWKHALVVGEGEPRDGMGSYGKLTSVKDLPPKKTLLAHIKRAMQLNLDNVKSPAQRKAAPKPPPEAPADLVAALEEERDGAQDVRRIPAERATRLRRMDRRSQARGDARQALGAGRRMDGRGQAPQLEVRELLTRPLSLRQEPPAPAIRCPAHVEHRVHRILLVAHPVAARLALQHQAHLRAILRGACVPSKPDKACAFATSNLRFP
jgi:hypothetical protein